MEFAYRELFSPAILGLLLCTVGALTILFAIIGLYGTRFTLDFGQRLLHCLLWSSVCTMVCLPTGTMVLYLMRRGSGIRIAIGLVPYVLVTPLLCAPVPFVILERLFHVDPRPEDFVGTYFGGVVILASITAGMYYVLFLRASHNELVRLVAQQVHTGGDREAHTVGRTHQMTARTDRATRIGETAERGVAQSSLLSRIPRELGRDLVCLKVSGHYLEVVTTRGSRVIIHSLADAVRGLQHLGMQTHRSYWVAYAHINYVVRRERRTLLQLTGDHEVPVSRTFLADVRRRVEQLQEERRSDADGADGAGVVVGTDPES